MTRERRACRRLALVRAGAQRHDGGMSASERHPLIDRWLRDQFGEHEGRLLRSVPQLTAMILAAERPEPPELSEEVLTAWRHLLVRERLTVNQSEVAFVKHARRCGWSWRHIGEVLGLPEPATAEQHYERLKAEVVRSHPSNNPRPYLP